MQQKDSVPFVPELLTLEILTVTAAWEGWEAMSTRVAAAQTGRTALPGHLLCEVGCGFVVLPYLENDRLFEPLDSLWQWSCGM